MQSSSEDNQSMPSDKIASNLSTLSINFSSGFDQPWKEYRIFSSLIIEDDKK